METNQMNYAKFLSLLMFNRVYDSKTISFLIGNDNKASRYRQKALANNHIKKTIIKRKERTTHSATFYSLTKKGLSYLIDHDQIIIPALALDEAEPYITAMRRDDRKIERKEKIARDASILELASRAGCSIPYQNFKASIHEIQEGDDGKIEAASIDDYIRGILTKEAYESFGLYPKVREDERIIFHNNTVIKTEAGEANSFVGTRDFSGGRYSGVADSDKKSLFIYASPMFGMRWSYWLNEKEIATQMVWRKHRAKASQDQLRRSGNCAAIVVDDPKSFANLYHDVDNARKTHGESFGGRYDHFYVLPFNEHGTEQLGWLMTTDDDIFNEQFAKDAVGSGAYRRNKGSNFSLFPIMNENNQKTALGFQFDTKKLDKIIDTAKRNPAETFCILCFKWQVPYYEKVKTENIKVIPIKFE